MSEPNIDEALLTEHIPDVQSLFVEYNSLYFQDLLGCCTVEWSDRMTLCAGICYSMSEAGQRHCTIRLSRPLLQYRPFSDTINTLLHEMIHAYIFIKFGGTLQRDGHGPDFQGLMHLINRKAGSTITVYHTFHAEVKECRKHIWRCQGPCQNRAPFYGWVRRSMNRPPQPADWWWKDHQARCGGTYIKISGPVTKAEEKEKKGKRKVEDGSQKKIDNYFDKFKGKGRMVGSCIGISEAKKVYYSSSLTKNDKDPNYSLKKGKDDVVDLTLD